MNFFKKKKNLNIFYENKYDWMPDVEPIKNKIPQWYKNIQPLDIKNHKDLPLKFNVKHCRPFLDSLTSGYSISLPADIAIKIDENNKPVITWSDQEQEFVGVRSSLSSSDFEYSEVYHKTHFVWKTLIAIELPKGYSCLITHPLNRYDLPFITLSGVVDADYKLPAGNIPFYVKKDFQGLIKAGTPIMQVIPVSYTHLTLPTNREV